jgi:hypothetical protein
MLPLLSSAALAGLFASSVTANPVDLPQLGNLGGTNPENPTSTIPGLGGDIDLSNVIPSFPASPIDVSDALASLKTSPVRRQASVLEEVEAWIQAHTRNATSSAKFRRSPQGLSLPPLIPSIPGVTEPLASNAPPLPVLQVPTPPLDSPPFTPSNIKPKKIGYFWTGAGDNIHKDFLVTASLDDVSVCYLV